MLQTLRCDYYALHQSCLKLSIINDRLTCVMGPGTVAVRKATPVDKTPNNTTGAQEYNQLLIQQIT